MDTFFNSLDSFTAGFALALGFINLVAGLHKEGERTYLLFGIIGVGVAGYFYLPELLGVEDMYSPAGKFSFSFVYLFYGLFPWFFSSYTDFHRPRICLGLNLVELISFFLFMITPSRDQLIMVNGNWPLWNLFGHLYLVGLGIYGLLAGLHQIKAQRPIFPTAFMAVMIIYNLLLINELFAEYFGQQLLLPPSMAGFATLDFIPLFFMLIMGIRLANDAYDRLRFERAFQLKDQQWKALLEKMKFLVTVVDRKGNLTYVNPYFLELTGYTSGEVIGKKWFKRFIPAKEAKKGRETFKKMIAGELDTSINQSELQLASGEIKNLTWSIVPLNDHEGQRTGFISIGADITEKEKALEAVKELKSQLEKEYLHLKEEINRRYDQTHIIGQSDTIQYAINRSYQVAATDATVLLEGETGVGKELFADLIHRKSKRSEMPLVKVNCAALPRELIESELFGHEKGAFTGATQQRKGRFELANGGTLFLDEIGELPLELQPKLLRVLQKGEFERLGGSKTIKVNVRIISASNRNLREEIEKGQFREDLFYRLNVYPITIPPLRQRKEDIPDLVRFFVDRLAKKTGRNIQDISKWDLQQLQEYDWPGNVRELENLLERAIIISQGPTLRIDPGTHANGKTDSGNPDAPNSNHNTLPTDNLIALEEMEKNYISRVLKTCDWKINGEGGAAEILKLHPSTLRSKMKKLNIERPQEKV